MLGGVAIAQFQPAAHVRQPHAQPVGRRRVGIEPVLHRHAHALARALHREADRAALHQSRDPVLHRIFHQRLQQQHRDRAIRQDSCMSSLNCSRAPKRTCSTSR